MSSGLKYHLAVLLLFSSMFLSCGKLKGEFAFRNFGQEAYRKADGVPEFNKNKKIEWVFVFDKVSDKHQIGVVLLKKELVWIDIGVRRETINEKEKIIYGDIEDLDEGRYRILITCEGDVIAEREFIIFSEPGDF